MKLNQSDTFVKTAEGKLIGMNAHLGTVTLKFHYRVIGMTQIHDEELKF